LSRGCHQSQSSEAHNNPGNILRDRGKFDEALIDYGRAIAIQPTNAEAHCNRAEPRTFSRSDTDLAALESLVAGEGLPAGKTRISTVFDEPLFDRIPAEGDPSLVPVFVLGMPHSGSTLIEQILASHPLIHGAGELVEFERGFDDVLGGAGVVPFPEGILSMDGATLRRVHRFDTTDPAQARIIHTVRHPVDTPVPRFD
jgi:hypothetical protein